MKRIIHLISVQLWAVLGDILSIGKSHKTTQKALYGGVLAFTLFLGAVSFIYSYMMGTGLKMFNSLYLLPSIMMAVTCIIILFTTMFKVKGTIFGFRDYDMVMSLPVSTGVIVASRLFILYAFNFLFVIIMMVPMMIAYGILAKPGILFYIIGFISILIIPLVPIVVASVFGTLIAYFASKFRHTNLLNIILSVGLLVGIVALSFTVSDNGQELVDMGKALTNQVNSIFPLAQMYADAVIDYDFVSFILLIAISLFAFVLYSVVVKLGFKRINTLMMTGRYHADYKMGEIKAASPFNALYRKELKRYFSSALYVMNSGVGIVLLTVGAVAFLFVDPAKILGSPEAAEQIRNYIPLYLFFCIIMTCPSMASISLEGRNLWILKSIPVEPKTIYLAKAAVNLTIVAPAILDTVILGIGLKLGLTETLLLMINAAACSVFISLYGLFINIVFPNFNWTSEVVVIKQSAACMITIFSGMAFVALQIPLLMLLKSFMLTYLVCFLIIAALDVLLYQLLMKYGRKRFYSF